MQNRSSYRNSIAGDTVQLLKTKDYLNKLGVEVEVNSEININLHKYDLVHLFNIMPIEETHQYFLNAQKQRKCIVLSTIYWDPTEYLDRNGEMEKYSSWWNQTMPLRKEVMKGVKYILPNSQMELNVLAELFKTLPPAEIVPNAADTVFFTAKPDRFIAKYGVTDFLLSVGRICKRKNQLSLIKAAKKTGLPLVIIGPVNDTAYYQECRREAVGGKIKFIDALSQTDLASAYAAARAHALVSWYDTPGLVSLEAALAGCNIVTTDRGSTREYFQDDAFYCDPGDLNNITEVIKQAWQSPPKAELRERIFHNFTWDKAAAATYRAYLKALRPD